MRTGDTSPVTDMAVSIWLDENVVRDSEFRAAAPITRLTESEIDFAGQDTERVIKWTGSINRYTGAANITVKGDWLVGSYSLTCQPVRQQF